MTFIFPGKVKQTSVVILSEVLLHIHAVTVTFTRGGCTVWTHSATVGHWAALHYWWAQIKKVESPRCISSPVNVKFKFSEHTAATLCLVLQNVTIAVIFNEAILLIVIHCSSSAHAFYGAFFHIFICHWNIYGTVQNAGQSTFKVPAQVWTGFIEDSSVPHKLNEPLVNSMQLHIHYLLQLFAGAPIITDK